MTWYIVSSLLFSVCFILFVYRYLLDFRFKSNSDRPPFHKMLLGTSLLISGLLGLSIQSTSSFIRIISPILILYCLVVGYIMSYQIIFLTELNTFKSKLFWITTGISIIMIGVDLSRGDNTAYFFSTDTFKHATTYYLYYILFFIAELCIIIPSLFLFKNNIHRYNDDIYQMRCRIGYWGYIAPLAYGILAIINLTLSAIYNDSLRQPLNVVGYTLLLITGILWSIYVLPSNIMAIISKLYLKRKTKRDNQLIDYLYKNWMTITPNVPYTYSDLVSTDLSNELRKIRRITEIDQARYLAWTHQPRINPTKPKDDANYINKLIIEGITISIVGNAIPPPTIDMNSEEYHLKVAKHLKRMNTLQKLKMWLKIRQIQTSRRTQYE